MTALDRTSCAVAGAFLLLGCPGPRYKDLPEGASEAGTASGQVLAGNLVEGRYVDSTYAFSISLSDGWAAEPRLSMSPLRVVLLHRETGTRVEVRVEASVSFLPRERPSCRWTFEEPLTVQELSLAVPVRTATCTPRVPGRARALAWIFELDGRGWEFVAVVPDGRMKEGGDALRVLLDSFTLVGAP